jgi:hypothetical protein
VVKVDVFCDANETIFTNGKCKKNQNIKKQYALFLDVKHLKMDVVAHYILKFFIKIKSIFTVMSGK